MSEVTCPECGSQRLYKAGNRYLANGEPIQRWLCRDCGYRFSEKKPQPLSLKTSKQPLNSQNRLVSSSQICAILEEAKNLTTATETKTVAGEKTIDAKGKIIEHAWYLKKLGRSDATIETRSTILRILVERGADLFNPESVKETIASYECQNNSKRVMVDAYKSFAKHLKISWEAPNYKKQLKIPFIPLEREIDDLIASCTRRTGTLLQLLKETGVRLGEALELKWTDIDFERKNVRIEPEKGSNPRILRITDKLLSMIGQLHRDNPKVFGGRRKRKGFIESLIKARLKASTKLQNPRLLQIHYHTLRHWKGTMEYHKTHDIMHVRQVLGHKSIESTMVYINIEQVLFEDAPEEFHVKAASDPKEIKELIEVGFQYVCEKDGLMFFRKRK